MLRKACNDMFVIKAKYIFGSAATNNSRAAVLLTSMIFALSSYMYGQNQRSYIYLDGRLVASESQALPISWGSAEIGSTGIAGSASYSSSTFTVAGSGADIWNSADAFRFVYQQISGDVTITARVTSQTNTSGWAKAGVMIRNGLDASAAHAFTAITPSNGLAFQRRVTAGGTSTTNAGPSGSTPYWVGLQRLGNALTSYVSTNGISWTVVGSQSISMSTMVYVGLAVTAQNNSALCTATFDNVTINALPIPWQSSDIGSIGIAGSAVYSNNAFTAAGSGGDIYGTADAFRYVYQQVSGDLMITARVTSQTNTSGWAKAGVMIRNGLDANAAHAFTAITPSNGLRFERRITAGGASTDNGYPLGTTPYWVRLLRSNNSFTSFISTDGIGWAMIGYQSISMSTTVYVGLAVTAQNNSALCTATFDNVNVQLANPAPTLSSINPTSKLAGESAFTLTATGTGFVPGSVVLWNGATTPTTYVSATQLTASIPSAVIATGGIAGVTVESPPPGGGTSGAPIAFYIYGQPTCLNISPTQGFAGIDPRNMSFCNGANMQITVHYQFTPWGGGTTQELEATLGTTDANGSWIWSVSQGTVPGTLVFTKIKNVARPDWFNLPTPYPTYTIRPPKPRSFVISPTILYLPGGRTLSISNSNNQTIIEEYLNPNPPGGTFQFPLVMNSFGRWSDPGYVSCGFQPIGTYTFVKIRNQLDPAADAWLNLSNITETFVACP